MKTQPKRRLLGAFSLCTIVAGTIWQSTSPPPPSSLSGAPGKPVPPVAPQDAVDRASDPVRKEPAAAIATAEPVLEQPETLPVADPGKLAAFDGWLEEWQVAPPEARAALEEQGERLAADRRPAFKALIMTDPQQALARSVPRVVRQDLPPGIVAQLEQPLSAVGDFDVMVSTPSETADPSERVTQHVVQTGGRTYMAYPAGQAAGLGVREELPFRGVAMDRELAVAGNPVRPLEVGERIPAGATVAAKCPVSGESSTTVAAGEPVTEASPTVEVGGELTAVCEPAHVSEIVKEYSYEGGWGGSSASFYSGLKPQTAGGNRTGIYRYLYIPLMYDGDLSPAITQERAEKDVADAARFWAEASFGKLKVLATITPPVKLPFSRAATNAYTMAPGAANYDGGEMLQYAAQGEIRKLGYDPDAYNAVVLQTGAGGGGVAWGGRKALIEAPGMGLIIHEVGHLLGLRHADAMFAAGDFRQLPDQWVPNGGSPFDYMGSNYFGGFRAHYHSMAKQRLGWLTSANIHHPTGAGGDFRIHAIDQSRLDDGKAYALRVPKDDDLAYVIEYRAHAMALTRQATVLVDRPSWPQSVLLDTTPGSRANTSEDYRDAGLTPGRTYSDLESDQHFTVLAEHDTSPPSIEVAYRRGPFPGNVAPVVNLQASSLAVEVGATVTFTADAADPNGDTLAYHWDFGDGIAMPNSPVVSRTFSVAEQVTAMVAVSDLKGGLTRRHVVVHAGAHGKQLVTGTISMAGQPLANVRVAAPNGNHAFTDADGNYALPGLPTGSQTLTAKLPCYGFVSQFNNPLNVTNGTNTANWTATGATFVSLAKTADASEGGAAGSFTLTRTGSTIDPLVVRVAKPTGTANSPADFTAAPAHEVDPDQAAYWRFTIPAGQSSLVVSVNAINDGTAEGAEVVRFQLGAGVGYETIEASTAEILIHDQNSALPTVAVTATDGRAAEPADPAAFTFTRSGPTAQALSVEVGWSGATNGVDYGLKATTVTIPAGQASLTVPVEVSDDAAIEAMENIVVTLQADGSYWRDAAATSATAVLEDDDLPVVSVEEADPRATESGHDAGVFVIHRTGGLQAELMVHYTLTGLAVEGVDYETLAGRVTIPAGAASAPVVILPRDDSAGELPETVILTTTSTTGSYRVAATFQGTLTLHDDGDLPSVRIRRLSDGTEGGADASFAIRAAGSSASPVTVNYETGGTAIAGEDYAAPAGSVAIPTDGSEVTVTIPVTGDASDEMTESLVISLLPSEAYRVVDDPVTLAIHDPAGDGPLVAVSRQYPTGSFGANRLKPLREGDPAGRFYFSRSNNAGEITVDYSISGTATATAGSDHTGLTGSVVIPAGSYGAHVDFLPVDDAILEATETVTVTILPGAGYRVDLAASATEEIQDNEPAVTVGFEGSGSILSEVPGEDGEFRDIPVVLSGPSASAVTVRCVAGAPSTAVGNGVDWALVDPDQGNAQVPFAALTFPPGVTTRMVRIRVVDDGIGEPVETAVLELQRPDFATLSATASTHQMLIGDQGEAGMVKEERWNSAGVYDNDSWDAQAPDHVGYLKGFTTAQGVGEQYSRRLTGRFTAPATGDYKFWIAADDVSELWLSPADAPAEKQKIAWNTNWTGFQEWGKYGTQQSASISLAAGQAYDLQVQHQELSGGDHVSVAWQGPGFSRIPLSLDFVAPLAPATVSFASMASVSREDDGVATAVRVILDRPLIGPGPVSVDYSVSGTASAGSDFTLAPGTLVFAPGEQMKSIPLVVHADALGESPESIVVTLSSPVGVALSAPSSHLVSLVDTAAPLIVPAVAEAHSGQAAGTVITTVQVQSARPISSWSLLAGNPGHAFAISPAGVITLAAPAALPATGTARLVVRATDDLGSSGDGVIQIACNSSSTGPVSEERWSDTSLFEKESWTNAPGYSGSLPTFATGQNVADQYVRRLTGCLKPTVTGNYRFWIAADDRARLYLGTGIAESSKERIAQVYDWTGHQAWDQRQGQRSAEIPLVAGQHYWIEVAHQEQSGGDHVSVAWSGPGIARQPIPASALAILPDADPPLPLADAPAIAMTSPVDQQVFAEGHDIPLAAAVTANGHPVERVEFYRGNLMIGSDSTTPYAVTYADAALGSSVPLTARAVFDGTFVTSGPVTIEIQPESPPVVASQTFGVNPFMAPGTGLGTVTAQLHHGRTVASWAIVAGNDAGVFGIDPTGLVTLLDPGNLPASGQSTLTVRVTDNAGITGEGSLLIEDDTRIWINDQGGSWPVALNWSDQVAASGIGAVADFATLSLTTHRTVTLDGDQTAGHLVFGDTSAPYHEWTLAPGTGGALTLATPSGNATLIANTASTVSAALAGSAGLNKRGPAVLTLSNIANSHAGGTTVEQGELRVSSAIGQTGLLGTLGSGPVTVRSGAALRLFTGSTTNAKSYANPVLLEGGTLIGDDGYQSLTGPVTLAGSSTIQVRWNNKRLTLAGTIGGTGSLAKVDSGTLILTGSNNYGGTTTVTAGTLEIGNGGTAGTLGNDGPVTVNGTIRFHRANDLAVANAFSGTGSVSSIGTGTTTLTGNNTYSGGTVVEKGTLAASSIADTGGAGAIGTGYLGITDGGTFRYTGTGSQSSNRVVWMNQAAGGTKTIEVVEPAAHITFSNGTGGLINRPITKAGAGALTLARAVTDATGAVTVAGGKLILTGASTYTGATTVNAGQLVVTGSLGATATTVAAAGSLAGTGTLGGATTVSGVVSPGTAGAATLGFGSSLTMAGGSSLAVDLAAWSGTAGTHWDLVQAPTLAIAATTGSPLRIVLSGPASGFTNEVTSFAVVQTTGGISGYQAGKVTVDASALPAVPGTWAAGVNGNQLVVTYTPHNRAPVAIGQVVTTGEDGALNLMLAGTDADGNSLTFAAGAPSHGTLSGTAPNLTYTPAADFAGSDSFTFTVNDGALTSVPATVSITVTPVNDAPVALAQSVTVDEDGSRGITLAGADGEGSNLTYAAGAPSHGTLSGTAPNLTYTPAADFAGSDSFTFTVNDGALTSAAATVSITVTPVNDAPVALAQSVTVDEDGSRGITLAGTDGEGSNLTYAAGAPSHGTLSGTAPNLTYTPAADFAGSDSFTFTVNDGALTSAAATVSITVTPLPEVRTWDISATAGIQNGAGTWSSGATLWTGDGGASNVAWTNGDVAMFLGDLGPSQTNVTLSGTLAVHDLTRSGNNGYRLVGSPGNTLAVSGTVTVAAGSYLIFAPTGANQFTGNFTKTGGGLLEINGGNDRHAYSGVTLNDGTIGFWDGTGWQSETMVLNGGRIGSLSGTGRNFDGAVTIAGNVGLGDVDGSGPLSNGALAFGASGTIHLAGATRELTIGSAVSFQGAVSDGGIVKRGSGPLTLASGSNSYTGDTTVSEGSLILADNARLAFAVSQNAHTRVHGIATATFHGDFAIDTSAVTASSGTWTLVDVATLTETFGATFTVAGWSESGNVWTKVDGAKTWTFTEATGVLALQSAPMPALAPGFDGWIAVHGLPGEAAAADADPDADGIPNLLEFVLGGDPGTDSASRLPKPSVVNGDLVFTFARADLSEAAVALTFEWSADLDFAGSAHAILVGATDSAEDGVTVAVTEISPDETDTITITVPAAHAKHGKLFGRLKAVPVR